jgi:hypothetical protein
VREVARSGHDKIKVDEFSGNAYFRRPSDEQMSKGDQHALDDFCCASDSVASWFQSPRGRRPDSLAAGYCSGGIDH